MRKFTVLLNLLFCIGMFAQNLNYNALLPENTQVKKGVLPNGLTYYIYDTKVIKGAASYYIIQNVGSVLENDNQQGLAHFLEHMALNGTDNFPNNGIINTLQKAGAIFGRDINAYTSFDETVYNMNNIPTTPDLIDTSLLVLRDWSNYISLENHEIDAERGVIKEEWRTRQNGEMRIFKKNLSTVFNNTIYAERMPIGSMDVIDSFDYQALKDFYREWYRTDLQAIAIIGDVDVAAIEVKVKKLFSPIPAVENPKERFIVDIPENEKLMYNLTTDAEVTTESIKFAIRHPKNFKSGTVGDLKKSLLTSMVTMMLTTRLSELKDNPDSPFVYAYVVYNSNSRTTNELEISVSPKANQQHLAFETVMKEVNRAVKFGFTAEEINRVVSNNRNFYENRISKLDDRSHYILQNMIQNNYLENETMTDIVKEYDLAKQIFDVLTIEEVHERMKNLYTNENRYLTVTGVAGNANLSESEALQIINSTENDLSLIAYKDSFSGKTLLGDLIIKEGNITSEKKIKPTNSTTFILSNGIKVHYKFANKNKNNISLNAYSYGGLSLVEDSDLASANQVNSLVEKSGLGDYSNNDLRKLISGKTASSGVFLSDISESVNGSSSTRDAETMLQMTYLRFTHPRFEREAFEVLIGSLENYLLSRSNNINEKINDSVKVALYGKTDPNQPLFNQDYVKKVSFETIKRVYKQRFKNASDFEFFIVGDISKEQLKPLLQKYIASIPTVKETENYKNNSSHWVSDDIEKEVFLKMEDSKSTVRITYKNDLDYSLKNALIGRALGDILTLRYTATLREQEGGTYGASVNVNVAKRPEEIATIDIGFDCNPHIVDKLVAIAHKELHKIAAGDMDQNDLKKTTTSYLKERAQEKGHNRYQMSVLTNFHREGYDMNDPENFENIINDLTVEDIKKFAIKVLKDAKKSEIVIKPSI